MILEYLNTITADNYKPVFSIDIPDRPVNSKVDWLRVTQPDIKSFHSFMGRFGPMLKGIGFTFEDSGRGLNGYTNAWAIQFNGENCGFVCADALDRMGGMIDLSGMGCQLLQSRWDLWCYFLAGLVQDGFAITRLDVATDFKGELWDKYAVNMVAVADLVNGGIHRKKRGAALSTKTDGDWLEVVTGRLSAEDYKPKEMCSRGLTIYAGCVDSVNRWVWYEKGKQLAGRNPDRYDGSLAGWIRCERRFGRGSGRSKVVIPFDFALFPDKAFVYECPGMKAFVDDWNGYQLANGVEVSVPCSSDVDLELVRTFKYSSLKKTAVHVAAQSSRFFRSLVELGIDPMEFVNKIISDEPTRGFDPDFHAEFSIDGCFGGVA